MNRVALAKQEKVVQFFSSGSTILDLALGGGWAVGRVFNIVGDKSTGKTLLAIEAFANFKRSFPKGRMRYAESEAALDEVFADQLGFPEEVERPSEMLATIEEFQRDLDKFCSEGGPSLYILDSLDSLSDDAEIKKYEKNKKILSGEDDEEGSIKGSYGAAKAKKMSELFRILNQQMNVNDCTLGVISQIRDKIGISFGEKHTRSGGRALDFYASQIVWLSETGKKQRVVNNQTMITGAGILSKVKKCKVGFPFREAYFDIIFGYGVDDETSMLEYLKESKVIADESYKDINKRLAHARKEQNYKAVNEIKQELVADTTKVWRDIEAKIAPPMRKYHDLV